MSDSTLLIEEKEHGCVEEEKESEEGVVNENERFSVPIEVEEALIPTTHHIL